MGGFFLSLGRARSYPPEGQKTPGAYRAFFGLRFLFSTFHPPAGRISLPAGQFHRAKRDFTRPQDGFHCREPGASGSASLPRARSPVPKGSLLRELSPKATEGVREEKDNARETTERKTPSVAASRDTSLMREANEDSFRGVSRPTEEERMEEGSLPDPAVAVGD